MSGWVRSGPCSGIWHLALVMSCPRRRRAKTRRVLRGRVPAGESLRCNNALFFETCEQKKIKRHTWTNRHTDTLIDVLCVPRERKTERVKKARVHTGALGADFDGPAGLSVSAARVRRHVHEVRRVRSESGDHQLGRVGVGSVVRRVRGPRRVGAVHADVDAVAADDAGHCGRRHRVLVVVVGGAIWRTPLDHDRSRVDHVRSDSPRLAGHCTAKQRPQSLEVKANSHRHARHDTGRTVSSCLVWRCELSRPDRQTGAFCVCFVSECVGRRSATAGRTPTQNALVRRSIHTATPDKTRLSRLPVDRRRRRDAGQARSSFGDMLANRSSPFTGGGEAQGHFP